MFFLLLHIILNCNIECLCLWVLYIILINFTQPYRVRFCEGSSEIWILTSVNWVSIFPLLLLGRKISPSVMLSRASNLCNISKIIKKITMIHLNSSVLNYFILHWKCFFKNAGIDAATESLCDLLAGEDP